MCFSNSVVELFADVVSTSATPNGKTGNNTPVLLHQPSLCCLQSVVGCGRGGRGLFKAHTHDLLCLKVGATPNEVRCQNKGASYCIHIGCIAVLPCFISFWSAALYKSRIVQRRSSRFSVPSCPRPTPLSLRATVEIFEDAVHNGQSFRRFAAHRFN